MENQLIQLYLLVCHVYLTQSETCFQHLSNNSKPQFTDQELVTIYLFGHLQGLFEKKAIHKLSQTEKYHNRMVSKIRQPIESFFNWLIDRTDIQRASPLSRNRRLDGSLFWKTNVRHVLISFQLLI